MDSMYFQNFVPDSINIDYFYEAHSESWENLFILSGIVSEIQLFYQKYVPLSSDNRLLIPSSQFIIEMIQNADGWEDDKNNMIFSGYIVKINNYSIHSAQKQDIIHP